MPQQGFVMSDSSLVGINLANVAYYSTEFPFIDRMKTAGSWIATGATEAVPLDKNGYPTGIPAGASSIYTLVGLDPASAGTSNTYVLTYTGNSGFYLGGATIISSEPGKITFSYDNSTSNQMLVAIGGIDPNAPPGNMHIVRSDQVDLFNAGEIFNPAFTAKVSQLDTLRYMDWGNTNSTTVQNWSDRTTLDSVTWQASGNTSVPIEAMVALANETKTNMWLNIPTYATDDYVRQEMTYVHDHLDPSLSVHLEYSNEVWNFQFQQAGYAAVQGAKLWDKDANGDGVIDESDPAEHDASDWVKYYGYRAAQVASIANQAFGADDSRLHNVLATQTAFVGLQDWIVEGVKRANVGSVSDLFDDYAVTTYFGGNMRGMTDADKATIVSWAKEGDAGVTAAIAAIKDGTGLSSNYSSLAYVAQTLDQQGAIAKNLGLALVAYEGGQDMDAGAFGADYAVVADFLKRVQTDPRMGDLYTQMVSDFTAAGGTLDNALIDVDGGMYGTLKSVYDTGSPEWDALIAAQKLAQGSSTSTTPVTTPVVTSPTPVTTPVVTSTTPDTTPVVTSPTPVTTPVVTSTTPDTTPVVTSPTPVTTPVVTSPTPVTTPVVTSTTPVTTPVVTSPTPVTTPVVTSPTPVTTPVVTSPTPVTTPVVTSPTPVTTPVVTSTTPDTTPVVTSPTPVTTPVVTSTTPDTTPVVTSPTPVTTPVVTSPTPVTTPVVTSTTPDTTPVVTSPTPVTTPVVTSTSPITTPVVTSTAAPITGAASGIASGNSVVTSGVVVAAALPPVLTSQSNYVLGVGEKVVSYLGSGNFTATGNDSGDTITGGAGNDTLTGGAGNDLLDGGTGVDTLIGGTGDDTYIVNDLRDLVIETVGGGNDTIRTGLSSYVLPNQIENLTYTGSGLFQGMGNALDNVITGGTGSNRLLGGDGNDTLIGGAGNDVLDGGAGADRMIGGAGDDIYFVDNVGDQVIEDTNAGTDTVYSSINYSLSANVENLQLTGSATSATGNELDNKIIGNAVLDSYLSGGAGNDTLVGGAGNDVLVGGPGADTLTGGGGADRFTFSIGDLSSDPTKSDTITDFSRTDGDKIDLSGFDADPSTAKRDAFTFVGTAAFSKHAGELRIDTSGTNQIVYGDLNGDGVADFALTVSKGSGTLIATDFVL